MVPRCAVNVPTVCGQAEGRSTLETYVAELHVHTVLSPCAAVEMIPPLIVKGALKTGINLIAITDHNASANVGAVQRAAAGTGLRVLPGLELQTREEVHLLCLFDTLKQVECWQSVVDAHLPPADNRIEFFGEQFVVDETGEFIRRETRLLSTSTDLSLKEAVDGVFRLGGITIAAHVDRQAFSLLGTLGFIPSDTPFHALEVSRHMGPSRARQKFPQLKGLPLVQGGDVHHLNEFLGANVFHLVAPTLAELGLALRNKRGRSFATRPVLS